MEELPVATARPRHFLGRLASARGAFSRWLRGKLRAAIEGRHAPLLLTAVFFSGMMLAMGYVADKAQRAADAIDEAHRRAAAERAEAAARARAALPDLAGPETDQDDDLPEVSGQRRPAALFYIRAPTIE